MTRREAREQAFVLIFERSINHETTQDIIDEAEWTEEVIIDEFAEKTAEGVEKNETALNKTIQEHLHGWSMNRLSKVSLALLRLALYEMMIDREIPVSISISEAVRLAKKYGSAEDAPFVNGVLGSAAKLLGEPDA